ncbi:hypothetical protein [Clostridium sp. HBUAS56010]|uniref:hypothetical protein n=1 Tax=Clostridium sp. HBUAS56010 TaxID=2571127 RepID=UPI001177D762|nr:hypothetical protein [Clostridium sp. HBUAS56010]
MNSQNVTAIKDTNGICFKCLKKHNQENVHKIHIPSAGYGSYFDNLSTELQLCDSCYAETDSEWWEFESVPYCNDGGRLFKYDDEIRDYLKLLLLPGQELVWNRFAYGACANYNMDGQDWIDFKLGELPHKKCKEYGFYSPDEIKAYQELFTTCQYPMNEIHNDGSIGCYCPYGASGKKDQQVSGNISSHCYGCKKYKKRETPILSVKSSDWEDLILFIKYRKRKNYLEEKFGKLKLGI